MGIFVSLCSGFSVRAEIGGEDIFGRKKAMFSEDRRVPRSSTVRRFVEIRGFLSGRLKIVS